MKTIFILALCLMNIASTASRGPRKPSCMSDEQYDIIVKLVQGTFQVPCAERSQVERTALIRFYRNRERFTVKGNPPVLYFDGKEVLKTSQRQALVINNFYSTKGCGARRLNYRLKDKFTGLSEPSIQNVLSKSQIHRRLQVKFTNRAPIQPVTAKSVMDRVQIDLIDMKTNAIKYKGKIYRYILSTLDVFSRYVWLRPLGKKSSSVVAKELATVFDVFGNPRIVQNDQGSEFRGKVSSMIRQRGIKIIRSSPYHPQSQGKVERFHKNLKTKILFDLLTCKKAGLNWVRELPLYAKLINQEPKEVLSWKSPFEIFYGRKAEANSTASDKIAGDINKWMEIVRTIRRNAHNASQRINKRTIKYQERKLKVPIYKIGDNILLKLKTKRSRVSQKLTVCQGKVIGRKLKSYRYKVVFYHPTTKAKNVKWVPVSDITADTLMTQRQRERVKETCLKKKRRMQIRKFYHVLTHDNRIDDIHNEFGLNVNYDPNGDGNCQFNAICYQLQNFGIFRSHETLRREVVDYLESSPHLGNSNNQTPWSRFLTETHDSYLSRMSQNATYGDHLTLQAISEIFNIQIIVVSTLNRATSIIRPDSSNMFSLDMPYIVLGHFAEGQGDHYVSLSHTENQVLDIVRNSVQITYNPCDKEDNSNTVFTDEPFVSENGQPDISDNDDRDIIDDNPDIAGDNERLISEDDKPVITDDEDDEQFIYENDQPDIADVNERVIADEERLADNEDEHFCADTDERIIANDDDGIIADEKIVSFFDNFPFELLLKVVEYAVSRDVASRQFLRCLNWKFNTAVNEAVESLEEPRLYINYHILQTLKLKCSLESQHVISVGRLIRNAGKSSGLAMILREYLPVKKWYCAWLVLKRTGSPGWFVIKRIFWRGKSSNN